MVFTLSQRKTRRAPRHTAACYQAVRTGAIALAATVSLCAIAQAQSMPPAADVGSGLRGTSDSPLTVGKTLPQTRSAVRAPEIEPESEDVIPFEEEIPEPTVRTGTFASEDLDTARIDTRTPPVDGPIPADEEADDGLGLRLGTFTLRPELQTRIAHERSSSAGSTTDRTYSETIIRGTLTSNWARHELSVVGEGTWQHNLAGVGETEPSANLDAALRLDLAPETTATLRTGYRFSREDSTDPNALAGATTQASVHAFTAGVALARELGLIRATLSATAVKTVYGNATLSNGTTVSNSGRDTTAGTLVARVGYEASPVFQPFIEGRYTKTHYDNTLDAAGYARSSDTYALRGGTEIDFGEKLNGEIGVGYALRRYDDSRLAEIGALTVDGTLNWSPERDTTLALLASTTLEESTTAGDSGSVAYILRGDLERQLRERLSGRLGAQVLYRQYESGSPEQTIYSANAGLSWSINRYLDLDGDVTFERTTQPGTADLDIATIAVGITARR